MNNRTPIALFVCAFAIMIFFMGALQVHAAEDALVTSSNSSAQTNTESEVTIYQLDNLPVSDSLIGTNADRSGPVLKDVRSTEQGGQMLLVKTWDVPSGYDAELLVEEEFEKGGLRYKKAYLLQVSENFDNQRKLASETVTITHDKKDDAIVRLLPIMDYNQDGFSGQLTLQADAIVTEAMGQNSYNYAVTDVREYTGLERNDPYSIPKTVEKNGIQLQLEDNIRWTQMGEGSYKATASYSGYSTGSAVTGYRSTATYIGEVVKETLGSVTYAVVYEGSVIPPVPFDFSPYLITGGGAIIMLVAAIILLNRRDNTKVYAMIGKEFQLVHKQKLTSLAPIIDLSPQEIGGQSDEFMITLDRMAVRKMRGHSIKIIGKDGMMKEQRIYKVRHFHIGQSMEEDYE